MSGYALGAEMFAALVVGHMMADYPLQGDFLARGKNVSAPIPTVPWPTILASHAIIQGGVVWALAAAFLWLGGHEPRTSITLGLYLGLAETAIHAIIDHLKCSGKLGSGEAAFNRDQALHLICKASWSVCAVTMMGLS